MNRSPLLWLSIGLLAAGAVIALVAKSAAEKAAFQAELDGAALGYQWEIEPNYAGMWIGIIMAALGVVGLLLHLQRRPTNAPASVDE